MAIRSGQIATACLAFLFSVALLAVAPVAIAGEDVYVRGHYRTDGTYVRPHYRRAPDDNPYNNWSYPGNVNPHTGKKATGVPSTYLRKHRSTPNYTTPNFKTPNFTAPRVNTPAYPQSYTTPRVNTPAYSPSYATPQRPTPSYTTPQRRVYSPPLGGSLPPLFPHSLEAIRNL